MPYKNIEDKRAASKVYKKRSAQYIKDVKKSSICADCGNTDYRVFDFHHIGEKLMSISNTAKAGWSIKRIINEIKKCIVLCSNCHRIRHCEIKEKENEKNSSL